MGSPVIIQTRFGTLSAGLRTNHTARGKHARVETGRNMPGTQGKCLSTLNSATSRRSTTFRIVDPVDDLGVTYTPEVQQFRAGITETCILTSCCRHWWEAAFDLKLLILVGRSEHDGAYGHLFNFTISSVSSP
jgi:hypothetical protein